jgi:hypothetical protein
VFPFRRLLRLAGLRWRYSNPPPNIIRAIKLRTDEPVMSNECDRWKMHRRFFI